MPPASLSLPPSKYCPSKTHFNGSYSVWLSIHTIFPTDAVSTEWQRTFTIPSPLPDCFACSFALARAIFTVSYEAQSACCMDPAGTSVPWNCLQCPWLGNSPIRTCTSTTPWEAYSSLMVPDAAHTKSGVSTVPRQSITVK